MPTQELLTTVHERLAGTDGEGLGLTEDVYTAGAAPPDADAPYVVVEVPRQPGGTELLDGTRRYDLLHAIRVHTRFDAGKADRSVALSIADSVDDALKGAPITIGGKDIHIPVPNQRPIPPYDVGGKKAYDISIQYALSI